MLFFEKDYVFDVVGLGKHIYWLDFSDGETMFDQIGEVPAEGCRVAGDIHQSSPAECSQLTGKIRCSLAGWIYDYAIKKGVGCYKLFAGAMDRVLLKTNIGKTGTNGIFLSTTNCRALTFDA